MDIQKLPLCIYLDLAHDLITPHNYHYKVEDKHF